MSSDYSVNPAAPYQLYQVGPEAEPMILVDGALAYPRSIVDHAASDCVGKFRACQRSSHA